jgi:hypothetical protein
MAHRWHLWKPIPVENSNRSAKKKPREASDIENRRKKTYSAERVILEVESDVAAMFLDDAENL